MGTNLRVLAGRGKCVATICYTCRSQNESYAMTEAKEWHAAVGGQSVGPMTKLELGSSFRSGEYNQETLVFKPGMSGWVVARQIPELSDILSGRDGAGVSLAQ